MRLYLSQLIASFLMLVLGANQATLANEVFSKPSNPKIVALNFAVQPTTPNKSAVPLRKNSADAASSRISISKKVELNFAVESADSPKESAEETSSVSPDLTADFTSPEMPNLLSTPAVKNLSKKTAASADLFATKRSPGSIAVGAAEGNLTSTGKPTRLYLGHIDPGNQVVNRGFCSWNRAKDLTVRQADERCLVALQRQSAKTERNFKALKLDSKTNPEALVNGTDLWNQSNSAGPQFANQYKKALSLGLKGKKALTYARVEAFRNSAGELDARGLFKICAREPYYKRQLDGLTAFSAVWRWNCIALDQGRRVGIVSKALKRNIRNRPGKVSLSKVRKQGNALPSRLQETLSKDTSQRLTPVALNFEPDLEPVSPPVITPVNEDQLRIIPDSSPIHFQESSENVGQFLADEASRPKLSQSTLSKQPLLDFNPVPVTQDTDHQLTAEATNLGINSWTSQLRKAPKAGDKIAGYRVTSSYGKRVHPLTGRVHFHGGVDLGTPTRTNLYAIGKPGTKTALKCWTDIKGGGLVATMNSPSFPKLKFDALHLSWCRAVNNGSQVKVKAGEVIGGTGNTGHSSGPHLHFQLRDKKTGKRLSPSKGYIWWALTGKEPKSSKK